MVSIITQLAIVHKKKMNEDNFQDLIEVANYYDMDFTFFSVSYTIHYIATYVYFRHQFENKGRG